MPAPAHRASANPIRALRSDGKRGYPDDVISNELDRLAAVGLIDDADFAEQWVRFAAGASGKR